MKRGAPLLLLAALFAIAARTVRGQVAGRVVGEDGRAIAGAAIEVWSGSQRLAMRTTADDGAFAIPSASDSARGPLTVTARKIGFRPVSTNVGRGNAAVVITLAPLPPLLDEVVVNTGAAPRRDPCDRSPSPEAAAIFARAASFYRDDTRWLDRIARYVHAARSTHTADRETILGLTQRGGWTRNEGLYDGPVAGTVTAVPRRLSPSQRFALAFPAPENTMDQRGVVTGVVYPRFYEWDSPSFVSRAFVDSMPKSLVSKGRQGIVLGFCPRSRRAPYAAGEIELGLDSTIIAIRWHFIVARRGEEAGGISIFAAPESKAIKAHLLPTNAIFWSRLPNSDRFETTEYSYGRWLVAELGDVVRTVPP